MSYLHVLVLFLAVVFSLADVAKYQIHAQHDPCVDDRIHDQQNQVLNGKGPPKICIPRIPGAVRTRSTIRPPPKML
ncbi:hypothetical protein MtrunA17_Chr2g0303831 [Medicago truncatula]|uniref:Leguminosin proline-rich group669 secreted peptide n=1 Tax=Medicago truncatula TaxID=3880 RepID=G7IGL3_MEDTR|nr:leguminosin proline-rich group669 secreted peptide [Medicago truncatula]RHN73918.1 hypothetical protein MtrunA17_Chr2g0303831 [Medicago truncatula]